MILTKEQLEEFEVLSRKMMEFLCKNFHPHVKVIIEPTWAEILEESAAVKCDEFVED